MIPIQQLLLRFKKITNTDKIKKEVIVDIFKKNNIPLTVQQISFLKNSIIINVSPIIKTEFLLKKESINHQIKNTPGFEYTSAIQ